MDKNIGSVGSASVVSGSAYVSTSAGDEVSQGDAAGTSVREASSSASGTLVAGQARPRCGRG